MTLEASGATVSDPGFRAEVQGWLVANLPTDWTGLDDAFADEGERLEFRREWQRRLYRARYAGITWPRGYGGGGQSLTELAILLEESELARAPEPINRIAMNIVGPAILAHGTDRQKEVLLPRILSGDDVWCQGFSEPSAGSDLAALRTRAEPSEVGWRITGQKTWTSLAHAANRCLLLARTDPDAERHRGITCFLLSLDSPGVEVRRIKQITEGANFCEVFLDGVVADPDSVLGAVGDGWRVAVTTLSHERGTQGVYYQARLRAQFADLAGLALKLGVRSDPSVRRALAQFLTEVTALRAAALRSFRVTLKDGVPPPEASGQKLFWSELNQRMIEYGWELLGLAGQLTADADLGRVAARWQRELLWSRRDTIAGGTSEIVRNVLAERVLGLRLLR
jgi:alkylation response protein AidB-like acyl-CoA dehydrogenase